jgi:hypothetical protein
MTCIQGGGDGYREGCFPWIPEGERLPGGYRGMRTYLILGYRRWQLLKSGGKWKPMCVCAGHREMMRPGRDLHPEEKHEQDHLHSRLSGGIS